MLLWIYFFMTTPINARYFKFAIIKNSAYCSAIAAAVHIEPASVAAYISAYCRPSAADCAQALSPLLRAPASERIPQIRTGRIRRNTILPE